MTFRIGQKVICTDPVDDLIKGHMYTITGMHMGNTGLFLNVDQVKSQKEDWAFFSWRFRRVTKKELTL